MRDWDCPNGLRRRNVARSIVSGKQRLNVWSGKGYICYIYAASRSNNHMLEISSNSHIKTGLFQISQVVIVPTSEAKKSFPAALQMSSRKEVVWSPQALRQLQVNRNCLV